MRKFISIFAKFCLFLIILFEAGGFVFRTHEYIATKILMLYQPDTLYYGHGFEIGIVSGLLLGILGVYGFTKIDKKLTDRYGLLPDVSIIAVTFVYIGMKIWM